MKKGFTIIELLITIAIIGIISTTVVFAYQQITDRNYQTIYEAKVKEIETGALKYADANLDEIKTKTAISISIDELIETGYLEGDSEDKFHILDPRRNKDYINGYVLIYFEGKNIKVEFNAESITVKLTQDRSNLTSTQIKLKSDIEVPENLTMDYCIYELNDLKGYYSSFTSGKLKGNACNNYTFNNINYFIDVISGKPVITHTATIKIYDNFGREIKQSITARVKEETTDETIEVDSYYATNYPATKTKYDNKWTNQNIILVPKNKNNISYEYSLNLSTWNTLTSSGYVQSKQGDEYPVYIRKIVNGVIGKSIGIIKTKIDKTAPTCSSSGDSTTWTNANRTINKRCNDAHSGCSTANTSQTFSITTQRATIPPYTIKDKAGNTTVCPARTANVYVDKTAPTCSTSGESTTWTNGNRTIVKKCSDAHSGCATGDTTQTFSTTTQRATIAPYTVTDKAGNKRTCPAKTANVYVDKGTPTCSWKGTSSSWAYSRTVSVTCGSTASGCDPSASSNSWSYSTTTQTANLSYVIKNKAGTTATCTYNNAPIYVDRTAPTCSSSGDSTTWTNANRTINKRCNDAHSGCATANISQTFSTTTKTSRIAAYTITDKVGNTRTCPARTANVYVDKIAPTCTNSGDSTSWTRSNRVIYKGCSDANSGCSTGTTSQTFSSTTTNATIAAYTIKDKAGNSRTCPSRTAKVYVDKGTPTCSWKGTSSSWAYSRTVSVTCGSTASGCDPSASSNSWSYSTTTQTANLSYVIKNKAGTTATCTYNNAPIYVDRTAPTCSSSGDSTTWTRSNRTIYKNCNDAHSGCSTANTSQTFSSTIKNSTIAAYTITDKVGNSRTCPARTANVYVDKTAPTCTNSGDSTSWTRSNRLIYKGCSDSHSGCSTGTTSQTFSSTTTNATIAAYTIKDKAGNSRTCPARTAKVYVDKTAPTCTSSGDSTTWTRSNRTIYKGCSDSHSGCSTGTTSHTFSSNAKTGKIPAYTVKDKAGNSRSCPARTANVYVDKTAPKLWYVGTCGLSSIATVCHQFNFSDNSNDTIYLYRSYCCKNSKVPNGNSNYCNTSNLTAKTRVERFKAGISNSPDNKSAKTTHNYGNHTYNYRTSFINTLPMHYAFIVCDKAGNCSGTYTYFCSKSSC